VGVKDLRHIGINEGQRLAVYKSERPRIPVQKKKRLLYRLNKLLAGTFNLIYRKGLSYRALGSEESLELLLRTGKSYIRYGNGESEIMVGLDMGTQEYVPELRRGLIRIVKEYSDKSNYLLGLCNWNLKKSVRDLKSSPRGSQYGIWRFMRYVFFRHGFYKHDMPFLESDMFRKGPVGLEKSRIEELWKDVSNLIVVYHNRERVDRFRENQKGRNVYFVPIPDRNCFRRLGQIQAEVLGIIKKRGIDRADIAVLVSAGPTTNILCYNLCEKEDSIRCYDMGNFFYMHYSD